MYNGTQAAGGGARRYTVAQAARRLGLSERGIRRRIEAGTLAAERGANGWRITAEAIAEALAEAAQDSMRADLGGSATATGGTTAASVPPHAAGRVELLEAVLTEVRGERDVLRERLAQADQERAELRRLLAAALQRPALVAPNQHQDHQDEPAPLARPWWRFWQRG